MRGALVGARIIHGVPVMKGFPLRYGDHNMRGLVWCLFSLSVFSCTSWHVDGLKCRTTTESQQNNEFEYVVRMCLRHMRNESDILDFYRIQADYESSRNNRHRDEMSGDNNSNNNNNNNNDNRNYHNRNRGYPEGFDRFWPSNGAPHDRNRYGGGDDDRNRQESEYEESDFFGLPRNGKDGRKKFKGRPQMPHSYQQQLQHDRDVLYNRGNRDSNFFYSNRNKNTKVMFSKDKNGDSALADIDPCVIHCIFQEMQLVDDNGKPNKGLISQRMTQKIRNSELKNFIQESVEECFDSIDDDDFGTSYNGNSNSNSNNNNNNNNNNNRYRRPEMSCEWAKAFAMCLESRGRENCDDWNEPMQKNHSNSNGGNGNGGSGKASEDQRHKSKQNDRG